MQRMKPMVGARLTVSYEAQPTHCTMADDQRLQQVVHVLLANAYKYTRKVW